MQGEMASLPINNYCISRGLNNVQARRETQMHRKPWNITKWASDFYVYYRFSTWKLYACIYVPYIIHIHIIVIWEHIQEQSLRISPAMLCKKFSNYVESHVRYCIVNTENAISTTILINKQTIHLKPLLYQCTCDFTYFHQSKELSIWTLTTGDSSRHSIV